MDQVLQVEHDPVDIKTAALLLHLLLHLGKRFRADHPFEKHPLPEGMFLGCAHHGELRLQIPW